MTVDDDRPDPDALLAQLREQAQAEQRGRLRIYFGASAGVGKTYAMLQAARQLQAQGRSPLVGVVETHGRSDTLAVLEAPPRLAQLPLRQVPYRGRSLPEFDLDGALERLRDQPDPLILVDELAHSNVPGSRHPKRWQDVEELLANGISVYTTLNVQHLESLNDVVGGITGVRVQETLPDTFFDRADEVVLVDTPADELLTRLKAGKVYQGAQAERAGQHFFRKGNLMALRELALRRTADRVENDVQAWRSNERIAQVWKTESAILCAIGPGDEAESVVRSAAQLAQQLAVSWHAVYVETPRLHRLSDAHRERVLRVVRLAEDLGATTAVLAGQEPSSVLRDYAREHNLSKLVMGRGEVRPWWQRRKELATWLRRAAPELDLVQVGTSRTQRSSEDVEPRRLTDPVRYLRATVACGAVALVCWPLSHLVATDNIVMLFLLGVVGVAMRLGRGPAVLASFLSVGFFDFFFVAPRLSLAVSDVQYVITFGVMLAVGLVTGQLTAGLRYEARVSSDREARARGLFELTRELAGALQVEQVVVTAEQQLAQQFGGRALIYVLDDDDQLQPSPAQAALSLADAPDAGTARWALDHEQPAGQGTDTLPGSAWFYLPLRAPMRSRGVLAIKPGDSRTLLLPERRAQLDTACRITGQALERVHYVEVAQQALLQIESERLRNSLLSALSHDLRTPLAALQGLAETLSATLADASPAAANAQRQAQALDAARAIEQQSLRINAMVHNLLDMARLQSGALKLNRQWQPIDEVVGSSLQLMGSALARHKVVLDVPATLPLVEVDAALLERVLANLLENAAKYTPPGSEVRVTASTRQDELWVSVADNGPGLPAGREEVLFEKFTRGHNESHLPGVGLGLAISRAIMQAHGGRIWAERAGPSGGARFSFAVPLGTPPAVPSFDDDESTGATGGAAASV
ncbi:DUF4118 domain-containing protein [Roseateles depolymerans]|uniref:histidine kinase n=1 Tax=Roseateles depolymerans TaxID=76731 RepID=A0A0U3D0Q9_9BURK|nr:DUF4118 domain-containing protein [Roseateles depolymerans]ALV07190.1 sensor protein KdpD [Roseateles depolymerans]REG20173.1 two-component system sensor histidine kinase KdpD [Roseateles depolymerans]